MAPPLLDYARRAHAAGLCVLPPREDGSKQPEGSTWEQWQAQRPDDMQLAAWYAGGRTGIGYVCGQVSRGLLVIDFDQRGILEAYIEAARAVGLGPLVDRLLAGYRGDSPHGAHLFCRCSEFIKTRKLARRPKRPEEMAHPQDRTQTLIEVKAEGGYIIAAPSNGKVHPQGGAYVLVSGSVETIPTITPEEWAELVTLAETFDEMPRRPAPAPRLLVGGTPEQPRPGDDFAQRTTWAEILVGWTPVYERGGVTFWRRPGKDHGISATTNYAGSDLFYPFTSSSSFEPECSYTKFGAFTCLNHDGDYSAAARALATAGYGAVWPELRTPESGAISDRNSATDTVPTSDYSNAGAKTAALQGTVTPYQSGDDPTEDEKDSDAVAARPPGTPWPRYGIGGCVYEVAGVTVTLKPERGKWVVTLHRGPTPITSDKFDLSSAKARQKFVDVIPGLASPEATALAELLLGLALVADQDADSWRCWHDNQREAASTRFAAMRAAEAEAEQAAKAAEQEKAAAAEAATIAQQAGTVLADPALLYRVGETIAALGVAGEAVNCRLLYCVFTSRIMAKPISAIIKGDAAGGKNNVIERTVALIPADQHFDLSGMSERALIYDARDYRHHSIIIFEVHGQGGEMGQYLLRSLISEGRLSYATVEKLDGELKTVLIEKPGPTNFVTTTTSPEIHAENETRIWSLLVDDTDATTRDVHQLQAQRAAGRAQAVDTTLWLQAQRWLALAGTREAIIPFAPELAKRMPRKPLRLRRDFDRLLSLIQVIAILHQVQRGQDGQRRVIATLADYAMARSLVEAVFQRAIQGVTEKTLMLVDLVDAVLEEKGADSTASYADLVARTGRPKMWVSRWLKPALQLGLVENLEAEKGRAARLVRGKFRLENSGVLPTVEQLAQAVGETVAWVDPLSGSPQKLCTPLPGLIR
jgi:hypothetical protein